MIIRQSDEEGTVVVLDRDLYLHQVMMILNQEDTYQRLHTDPTPAFRIYLQVHLEEGLTLGVFTPKIAQYINVEFQVTPIFHGLPKTHKDIHTHTRLKRACSSESLNKRLYQQGYKKWHTKRACRRVDSRTRKSLLFDQTKKKIKKLFQG